MNVIEKKNHFFWWTYQAFVSLEMCFIFFFFSLSNDNLSNVWPRRIRSWANASTIIYMNLEQDILLQYSLSVDLIGVLIRFEEKETMQRSPSIPLSIIWMLNYFQSIMMGDPFSSLKIPFVLVDSKL